jgi:tetratricopeptide (TPR) repeat protein
MSHHAWVVVIGVALLNGPASHAEDAVSTVIGVNPDLVKGAYALEFGNHREAVRLTLQGLRSPVRPSDLVGALSNLCGGYVGIEDFASALDYCNRALRIDDGDWHAYNNRSLAYLGLGDTDAAQRDLEKGLEINPDSRTLKEVERRIESAR